MITYTLRKANDDAVTLRSFGVHVDGCTGLIGKPSFKTVESFDWRYLHGTVPDLRNMRYKNREITVSCWMSARSKQELVERYNSFLSYFRYDGYIWLKVSWDNNDGNQVILPDPHASKGLYYMVYLDGVSENPPRKRFGIQYLRFELRFIDPFPSKRIYLYTGTSGMGVDYSVSSESEIDIHCEGGQSATGILIGNGHLDLRDNSGSGGRIVMVSGDVSHADISVTPTDQREDRVTMIYDEI